VSQLCVAVQSECCGYVQGEGFSDSIINRFFRPFLAGTFFDQSISVSSRTLDFVMRTFATGNNALPASGIQALSDQLAAPLEASGCIQLKSPVKSVKPASGSTPASVELSSGQTLAAPCGVVIATEAPAVSALLTGRPVDVAGLPGVGTCCAYFSADGTPPMEEPLLYLDGDGGKYVNNMCFPNTVAPSYAPAGKYLVSASTVGTYDDMTDEQLVEV
jgi:phytoene dehydrogenase-like protein